MNKYLASAISVALLFVPAETADAGTLSPDRLLGLGADTHSGGAAMNLYEIDPISGDAEHLITTETVGLRGLAIHPDDGTVYSSYGSPEYSGGRTGIVTIDAASGIVSHVGGAQSFVSLEFDDAGQLYGVENPRKGGGRIYEIDRLTGNASLLTDVAVTGYGAYAPGLAFDGSVLLLHGWNGDAWRVDPETGRNAHIGYVAHQFGGSKNAGHSLEIAPSDKSAVFAEHPFYGGDGDWARATAGNYLDPTRTGNNGLHLRGLAFTSTPLPSDELVTTFQQGVDGYGGTVDTFVRENQPSADNSQAPYLGVDGNDPEGTGLHSQALLRFDDLFGDEPGRIPADPGVAITSARLEVNTMNLGDGGRLHRMLRPWSDRDTWRSLDDGVQADGVEALATADVIAGERGDVPLTVSSFDVTASLRAWQADPESNFGWAFLPIGGDGWDFHSAETAEPPRLIVNYVPEPSSFALLGVGVLGLIAWRRRGVCARRKFRGVSPLVAAAAASFFLATSSVGAEIVIDDGDWAKIDEGLLSYTLVSGYDAGGSDKLVVTGAGERSFIDEPGFITGATYNGVRLVEAVTSNNIGYKGGSQGIFYLDNPGSAGVGDIVVSFAGKANGFLGSYLALSGTTNGVGPTSVSAGASTSLDAPTDGSFLVASCIVNGTFPPTANPPLTQVFSAPGQRKWFGASTGYRTVDAAGPVTPAFAGGETPTTIAAVFEPGVTVPEPEPGVFELVGIHPDAAAQQTDFGQRLSALAAFNGKIYAGYGDWGANTGPVRLCPFDPKTDAFGPSLLSSPTEAIDHFREIDGKLYAPDVDPLRSDPGGYAMATGGAVETWMHTAPLDATHVFDIVKFDGDLWMCGSFGYDATVWRHTPETGWVLSLSVPAGDGSLNRFYGLGVYDGKLYTSLHDYGHHGKVGSHVFDGQSWSRGPMLRPNGGMMTNANGFAGKLVYQGSYLGAMNQPPLNAFDGETATEATSEGIRDYKIVGDRFYALSITNLIRYTSDLVTWETLGAAPDGSKSLAVLDGRLYVGGDDGKLYRYSEPVPEPSAFALLGVAGIGLLIYRRCTRSY